MNPCPASIRPGQRGPGRSTGNASVGRAEDLARPHLAAWTSDTAKSCRSEASNQEKKTVRRDREAQKVPQSPSALHFSSILTSGPEPCRLSLPWASFLPRGDEMLQREIGSSFSLLCYVVKKKKNKLIKTHTTQLQFHHERSQIKNEVQKHPKPWM